MPTWLNDFRQLLRNIKDVEVSKDVVITILKEFDNVLRRELSELQGGDADA